MHLTPMSRTHNTYACGGAKIHIGGYDTDTCLCGQPGVCYVGDAEMIVDEAWNKQDVGGELCKKCKRLALKRLRQPE